MSVFPFSQTTRRMLLAGGALVAAAATAAALTGFTAAPARSGATASSAAPSPAAPSVPRPVPVTVDPRTTAYLVLDLTTAVCAPNPACVDSLPAAARLLARARAAGALVVYSKTVHPGDSVMPQVAPLPSDPLVTASPDKFIGTDLAQILSSHGITTLVLVGTKANGAIMYTSLHANVLGYTVIVAVDGVSADTPYIMHYGLYQLLNQPGFPNVANMPGTADAVTLTTTRQVTFTPAG